MCVGSHATRAKPRIVGKVTTHMRIVRVFLGSLRLTYIEMKILRVKCLIEQTGREFALAYTIAMKLP